MIIDKQMELSNAQAVTVTALSSNVLDLGPVSPIGNSVGYNDDLEVYFSIDQTFTAGGAATLNIQMVSADSSDLATNQVVHDQSAAIPVASLVAGSKVPFKVRIPLDAKRYFGINYVVSTGPFTAGKISARGVTERQTNA